MTNVVVTQNSEGTTKQKAPSLWDRFIALKANFFDTVGSLKTQWKDSSQVMAESAKGSMDQLNKDTEATFTKHAAFNLSSEEREQKIKELKAELKRKNPDLSDEKINELFSNQKYRTKIFNIADLFIQAKETGNTGNVVDDLLGILLNADKGASDAINQKFDEIARDLTNNIESAAAGFIKVATGILSRFIKKSSASAQKFMGADMSDQEKESSNKKTKDDNSLIAFFSALMSTVVSAPKSGFNKVISTVQDFFNKGASMTGESKLNKTLSFANNPVKYMDNLIEENNKVKFDDDSSLGKKIFCSLKGLVLGFIRLICSWLFGDSTNQSNNIASNFAPTPLRSSEINESMKHEAANTVRPEGTPAFDQQPNPGMNGS